MSIPVDPVALSALMQANLAPLAAKGAVGQTVTIAEMCDALALAIAAQVNLHTHSVAYIGAGTGSSAQVTEATPSGAP